MSYTEKQLSELKGSVPLWQVVSDRVPGMVKRGPDYWWCCPFHSEDTPSFAVLKKSNYETFYCQGCGKSGNIFQFIMEYDKISFQDAVEKVSSLTNWSKGKSEVERTFQKFTQKEEPKLVLSIDKLKPAEQALASSGEAQQWLQGRGISTETAQRFHIGYVQSAAAVNKHHPWVNEGWIVFPTIEGDEIVSLKYRSIKGKKTEDGTPGFIRRAGMKTTFFNLSAVEPFDDCMVVEGEPDNLVLAQAGYIAVSLPSGSYTPTPEDLDKLVQANTIYLAGDSDIVGNKAMDALWGRLVHRTFRLDWPEGCKDANETFLTVCNGGVQKFHDLVETLKQKARQRPSPNFFDLRETVLDQDGTNPMDDPHRLHFPWRQVDEMAVVRGGDVVSSYASYTGSAKTTFWANVELHEAIEWGSTVINYSGELSPKEYSQLVTAILCRQDRLQLKKEHYDRAAEILKDAKFYIGYNPELSKIGQILGDGTEANPGLLEWAIRRFGANIVVLDHLHFFTSGERDATTAEAAAMTRIKNLSLKYAKQGLIFIVIGQSRKAVVGRQHKVTEMGDAKGSESFSSTANATYHIHREIKRDIDWDHPENWPNDLLNPQTDIRLYKCRTKGPGKAVARLWFEGANGRFAEMIMDRGAENG